MSDILDEFDLDCPLQRVRPVSTAQSRRNKKFSRAGGFDAHNPKWKRQLRAAKALRTARIGKMPK